MGLLARFFANIRKSRGNKGSSNRFRLTLAQLHEWIETNSHEYILSKGSSQSSLAHIESCREAVIEVKSIVKRLSELSSTVAEKQRILSQLDEKIEQKKEDLGTFSKDPLYAKMAIYTDQQDAIKSQLKKCEAQIERTLHPLVPFLAEYSLKEPSPIVALYCNDLLEGFASDEGLHILHVLAHIKAMVKGNALKADTEGSIENLEAIREQDLQNLHTQYLQIQQQRRTIYDDNNIKDFALRVQETEYKLDHYTSQHDKIHDEVMQKQDQIQELTQKLSTAKKYLEDRIHTVFGKNVIITLS